MIARLQSVKHRASSTRAKARDCILAMYQLWRSSSIQSVDFGILFGQKWGGVFVLRPVKSSCLEGTCHA